MDQTVQESPSGYTFFRGATRVVHEHSEDAVEQEQEGAGTPGVSRGQNQLHLLPEDWQTAGALIGPLLDRLEAEAEGAPQLLVLTNDVEAAAGIAAQLAQTATSLRVLAATGVQRAARVMRSAPAQAVVGPPTVLVELLQSSTLKLAAVRVVVLAWVEDLDGASTRALETLMSEAPKDAPRIVIASAATPAVEQLVERYARRARRSQPATADAQPPVALSYLATSESGRSAAIRGILDALDPESAIVIARGTESRSRVEGILRSLGQDGHGAVRVSETPDAGASLVILHDLPSTEDDLRQLVRAAGTARVIALVAPRQIPALRRMAGGALSPFALPAAAERARTKEQAMRQELLDVLAAGQYSRELLALEPVLSLYDGAEVAAATLRLLETERAKPRAPAAETGAAAPMTKLFVNIGEMDRARPADLVGAITNEAGISRAELGRVDVREKHSTVEVATAVANSVVAKLNGATIKGRRVLVKVDEERERRPGPPRDRPGGGRSGPPRDRPGRPGRPPARPSRDRPDRDRPPRDNR
jgi:ATP-dependent RNA helicase DeaD